jgi:cellulose synthase/poly-beta-1,6-N-acetylglucosamine synthase-like glycosyltransferase
METGVAGATSARSLEICGDDSGSSSQFWKFRQQEFAARARRRAFALGANIEDVLMAAAERASDRLKHNRPEFSAATLSKLACCIPLLLGIGALIALLNSVSTIALCAIAVLPAAFRVLLVASPARRTGRFTSATTDTELPVYTIIAPLHREACVVDQLLSAIERLDYPAEKLDVIVIVEADEPATRAAITRRKHLIPITVIPAPPAGPRTKPKALNIALELARGSLVAIYDAEDRPEPSQLRSALQAFQCGGDGLACVQARLCIDTDATWLARYFTAEYAGHFDVFLPKLAEFGLPLPLGGSSNHFRTAALREVGAWDPYNVTEDADLGMRLARFGYRCGVIESTTFEEAPATPRRWLSQRARWFKGWMQTFLVHMREPLRSFRELGPFGFATFMLVVGGNAFVALAHPIFVVGLCWRIAFGNEVSIDATLCAASVATGYVPSVALAWRGLSYRGVPNKLRILAWTPLHWLLLSTAAWWAVGELILAPTRWNKTEHGLVPPQNGMFSLVKLSRHIADLERRGELPQIGVGATYSAADRRRRPRVSA